MPIISEQIYTIMRFCIPYFLMLLLFLLNIVFLSTAIFINIEVPFIIIMIYYWSIYRPTLTPPLLVFITGICFDLLSGLPVGISAFTFLLLSQIVSSQRLFLTGQTFMAVWLGFIIVGSIALFAQWFLFGLINLQWTPLPPVILSVISGILLFPAVSLALHLSHKALPLLPDQYSAVK